MQMGLVNPLGDFPGAPMRGDGPVAWGCQPLVVLSADGGLVGDSVHWQRKGPVSHIQGRGQAQGEGRAEAARRETLNFWGGREEGGWGTQEALGTARQCLCWRGCVCACWLGDAVGREGVALAWWLRKVTARKTRAGSSLQELRQLAHYTDRKTEA